jgi:transposase
MSPNDPRFLRGLALARAGAVRQLRRLVWSVKSATHAGSYLVSLSAELAACSCPDFEERGVDPEFRCKHVFACLIHARKIELPAGLTMTDEQSRRPNYGQDWHAYNEAQTHEREYVVKLLRDLCGGIVQPVQTRGRPRKPLADVVFACVLKVYTGFSSRRVISDVRAAQAAGDMAETLCPKTITKYLEDPALTDLLRELIRESASPLASVEDRFAVDSTGFTTSVYERFIDVKYGGKKTRKRWVKAHVICGVNTHVITDVIVADDHSADAPQLPELVTNTAQRFTMSEVSADKAYLSHRNFDAIESVGATPYIPFKIGNTGEGPALWRKMWALYQYKSDVFLARYHARSNVEATFSAIKRKFGGAVRAKGFVAQRNEVLCKCLAFNLTMLVHSLHEFGVAAEFSGNREGGHDVH